MGRLLTPPIFDDESKTQTARQIYFVVLTTISAVVLVCIAEIYWLPENTLRWLMAASFGVLSSFVLLLLTRAGRVRLTAVLQVMFIWLLLVSLAWTGGGVQSRVIAGFIVVALAAAILLGARSGLITAVLCSLTALFLVYAETAGFLPERMVKPGPIDYWVSITAFLAEVVCLQYLSIQSVRTSLSKARTELAAREKTEQALRKSEQEFRTLASNIPDVVARYDRNCCYIYVNDAVEREMHISPQTFLGKSQHEFGQLYNTSERSEKIIRHIFDTGQDVEYETVISLGQGSFKYYLSRGVPEFGPDGEVVSALFIHHNITEWRQAEKEISGWKQLYEMITAASRQVVYDCNLADNTVSWGGSLEQVLGYQLSEMGGGVSQWKTLIAPDDFDEALRLINAALEEKGSYEVEYGFRHKDGHYITILDQGFVIPGLPGQPDHSVGVMQDITERCKIEEEARLTERRLNSLLKVSQTKTPSTKELLDFALTEAVALSDSQFGFIFRYDETKQEFNAFSWSLGVEQACALENLQKVSLLEQTGVWTEAVRQRGPVIINDFSQPHPAKKGFPEDHIQILRFMAIPVYGEGQIVATVGVANKEKPYTDQDVRQLAAMFDSVWKIVERDQAEQALRESEVKFRAFIEQNWEGVALVDEEGRVIEWNRAQERITGLPCEEVLGNYYYDVQFQMMIPERRTPERYAISKNILMEMLKTGQSPLFYHSTDVVICRKDGQRGFVQQTVFPIKTKRGFRLGSITHDISEKKQSEAKIQALNEELIEAYDATIEGWANALELRDQETEGHSLRVMELTVCLASRMGIAEEDLPHLRRGAILHDIGKMGVPDPILLKPGPLTEDEWKIMRQHPDFAYHMLASIPFLRPALDIPYCHHEKWNGSGYPRGLKGEEIPIAARIFAVVDVWDALRSDRSYRPAWLIPDIIQHIQKNSGTHFDPNIVPVFLDLIGIEKG